MPETPEGALSPAPSPPPDLRFAPNPIRDRRFATGLLIVAWAIFFAHALLTGEVPFDRDVLGGDIPQRHLLTEWLRQGVLPQWSPYEMLGAPFVGSVVPATFHPQTYLLLWLSPVLAVKVNMLLAYLFAEAGAYRAARAVGASRPGAVVAAFAFAFGGYAVGMSNNLPFLVPFATMPWVLLAAWRTATRVRWRDAAVLAVTWALVLLGGDLQAFGECVVLVAAVLIIHGSTRRRVSLMLSAAVLACCLSAVELFPAILFAPLSYRTRWLDPGEVAIRWAFHPLRLLELFTPRLIPFRWQHWFGLQLTPDGPGVWSSTVFAGGVTLWLGWQAVARRSRLVVVLACTAALGVWLALGGYGLILPAIWEVVPLLDRFRFPEKYVGLAWVAGSVLAGLGLDALNRRTPFVVGGTTGSLGILMGSPAVVVFVVKASGISSDLPVGFVEDLSSAWVTGLLTTGAALIVAGIALRFWPLRRAWTIPAIVFFELYAGNGSSFRLAKRNIVEAEPPWTDVIRGSVLAGAPPPRTLPAVRANVHVTTNEERVMLTHAFMSGDDGSRVGLSTFAEQLPSQPERAAYLFVGPTALDALRWSGEFNLCFRIDDDSVDPTIGRVAAVAKWAHLELIHLPCRDRAYLAGAIPVANETAARERMQGPLPTGTVVWEGGPSIPQPSDPGSVTWRAFTPNEIALDVVAPSAAALVVSDAWTPGWSATVDDVPVPVWPTDVAVRGVAVPAGAHRVVMRYRAPGLRTGAFVTISGLVVIALLVLGERRRASVAASADQAAAASRAPP